MLFRSIPATVSTIAGATATVDAAGHRLSVPVTDDALRAGDAAVVMVRPERLHVSPTEPTSLASAVEATVVDLTFQGPVVRTALRTDGGADLVAHVGPEDDLAMLRPGDRLWAAWDLDAACLLRAAPLVTADQ